MRRFCIFAMSERFSASNLLRIIEDFVLNLRHCHQKGKTKKGIGEDERGNCKGEPTVLSSVTFSTSVPCAARYLTQYRVF